MFGKLVTWWSARQAGMAGAVASLEKQASAFPMAVTVLASSALLLGGRCAAWQWWGALVGVCAVALFARQGAVCRRLAGVGLFLALLAGMWVAANVTLTLGWMDTLVYHLPATRLLMEGWNPVFAATPEALAGMGVDPWEMRLWHVLSMPKSVWVFSAVAWRFTGATMNLFLPLFPFLFLTASAQVWRFLGGTSPWARCLAVAAMWAAAPAPTSSMVDCAVALGGMGLLAAMGRAFREGRWDGLGLVAHSFWLASAKQMGLCACAVFWGIFGVAQVWRHRTACGAVARRLVCVGATLGTLLCVVCVSPYLTMWRNYGHPLYPNRTADAERFPVRDITGDFAICNADAAAMGHVGNAVNAYASQSLAAAYYRWKLGQATFAPRRSPWSQGGADGFESAGPTTLRNRLALSLPLAVILLLGGWVERTLGVMVAAGTLAVPTPMLGYLRYVPWVWFVWPLALGAFARRVTTPWSLRAGLTLTTVALAVPLAKGVLSATLAVDMAYAAHLALREAPPRVVYGYYSGGLEVNALKEVYRLIPEEVCGNPLRTSLCNLRLLCRQTPALRSAEVRVLERFGEARDQWPTFPSGEFKVAPGMDFQRFSLFAANAARPDRRQRLAAYPRMFLEVAFIRFPRLLLWRLVGK